MTKKGKDTSSENVLHDRVNKPHDMIDANWEAMNTKAVVTIELCLANEVMYTVMDESSNVGL